MGVCLSKGHGHHHQGHVLRNDEESGFCTPEGVSSLYESRNPSGRYSFAHLETPRLSADVGDLGALGSLFYKRGSRSRDCNNTTTVSQYISPLDMFLGRVSGRNRVHHINQLCTGNYSFASYLASPLLKGFDVHAMEAVAKSYAESAAKAAARDAFVFLEENDISVVSSNNSGKFHDAEGCNVSSSSAAAGDDCGDVDDDLAKSDESEEWEEPSRKAENCRVVQNEEVETNKFSKSSSRKREEAGKTFKYIRSSSRSRDPNEKGTNEQWVSVLNAVQARAKARRRQRRKSSLAKAHGGSPFQRSGSGRKHKIVRFRLAGVEEGFPDNDFRSGKESESHQAPAQVKEQVEVVDNHVGEEVRGTAFTTAQEQQQQQDPEDVGDDCVRCVEKSLSDNGTDGVAAAATIAEDECDNCYSWQEDDNCSVVDEGRYGKEKIIEVEFLGFTFTSAGGLNGGVEGPRRISNGAATPSMGPRAAPPSANVRHFYRPSLESFSETSFGSSEQLEEEVLLESFSLPPGIDEGDEEMSSGKHHVPRGQDDREDYEDGADFSCTGRGEDVARQCCSADCCDCEAAPAASGTSGDDDSSSTHCQQEMQSPLFMKDISAGNDTPPAIQVGCVVVESRLPDGSRLTPQILDLSDVHLPERGEDNYGFFHARVLCHSGSSSPPSGSDQNPDLEGGFSFPVLQQPSTSRQSTESSSGRDTKAGDGQCRAPPPGDPETPIKNRSIRPPPPPPPPPPPISTIPVRQIHEISTSQPNRSVPQDRTTSTSGDPRCSFSFDTEQTVTKRTHEIVLPTLTSRSTSASPVFSPSKLTTSSLRSTAAAAASPFLSSVQVSAIPYPPRARRTLSKKLKFYSLERASYGAAGARRSKSPPLFSRQYRERRRDTDGESDSDLFEIETMSGTNAMGSSRTPPSTPTKSTRKWTAPEPASIDLDKLSDSIAKVSRSRSKRSGNNVPNKPAPTDLPMDPTDRCLPLERRKDSSVFQGRGTYVKPMSQSSLRGRALLKLGLLMRSTKQNPHVRSDFRRDLEPFRSSETSSVSEYLENRPPSPVGRYHPHGECGQCIFEEERAAANQNYAFEWYCGTVGQRVAPLQHEKRPQQEQGFSSHKSFTNEDRTFAVKN